MSFSISSIIAGLVFGIFGFAILKDGKKEANIPKVFVGLILLIYPYFITNDYLVWIIGIVLTFIGFKLRY